MVLVCVVAKRSFDGTLLDHTLQPTEGWRWRLLTGQSVGAGILGGGEHDCSLEVLQHNWRLQVFLPTTQENKNDGERGSCPLCRMCGLERRQRIKGSGSSLA